MGFRVLLQEFYEDSIRVFAGGLFFINNSYEGSSRVVRGGVYVLAASTTGPQLEDCGSEFEHSFAKNFTRVPGGVVKS